MRPSFKGYLGICVGLLSVLSGRGAAAGGISEGGGKGVVCRDPQGKIQSVELLDLWEAEILYGRKILTSNAPVQDQLAYSLDDLSFSVDPGVIWHPGAYPSENEIRRILGDFSDSFAPGSTKVRRLKGVRLEQSQDSFEEVRPKGSCRIQQVVRYHDGGLTLVDQDLVDKMDLTNQAALIAHESLYGVMRNMNETDSIRVRRSVGYVFSGGSFPSWSELRPARRFACRNFKSLESSFRVDFFEDAGGSILALNRQLKSRAALGAFPTPVSFFSSKPQPALDTLFSDKVCEGADEGLEVGRLSWGGGV